MKVILFLAAVYALIYNQSQQKKPPIAPVPTGTNYAQTFIRDSTTRYIRIPSYMNVAPAAILNVTATPAVMKTY